jgi:hypothetical protein
MLGARQKTGEVESVFLLAVSISQQGYIRRSSKPRSLHCLHFFASGKTALPSLPALAVLVQNQCAIKRQ